MIPKKIRRLLDTYIPSQVGIYICRHPIQLYRRIHEIQSWYSTQEISNDLCEVLTNISKFGLGPCPYPWAKINNAVYVAVFHDSEKKLPYVLLDEKRLYFPYTMSDEEIKYYFYATQYIEQHPSSPHRYLTDEFTISSEDIVVDCGAAEGNFSLFIVDKVKKVYVFEPEKKWYEPLMATFAPWKDKVEIIQKYISDSVNENTTTLDDYFKDKQPPTFCKIDVEGYEHKVLDGGAALLASFALQKIVVCTYHKAEDEDCLGSTLRSYNYDTKPSDGYMLFNMYDELKPPYFRRGLLRCTKK